MENLLKLTLLTSTLVQDRSFNNSIQTDGRSRLFPSALKVNDTYYVVSRVIKDSKNIFEISTSMDLNEWKSASDIFEGDNAPAWVDNPSLNCPRIHQIGSNFVLYFAGKTQNGGEGIGVAVAEHPLGPYKSIQGPLLDFNSANCPTIIRDKDKLYVVWSQVDHHNEIIARQLNPDGISFQSDRYYSVLEPSLEWEKGLVSSPWHMKRRNYHYLFYNGVGQCDESATGVARSRSPLGPYKKFPVPIIEPNHNFVCTESASIVKDLDGESDIIIFNGKRKNDDTRATILATLNWGVDEWPYVGNF